MSEPIAIGKHRIYSVRSSCVYQVYARCFIHCDRKRFVQIFGSEYITTLKPVKTLKIIGKYIVPDEDDDNIEELVENRIQCTGCPIDGHVVVNVDGVDEEFRIVLWEKCGEKMFQVANILDKGDQIVEFYGDIDIKLE